MAITTEPLPGAASPEHLTEVLRRAGVLGAAAHVRKAEVESSRPTILSRIVRLRLFYAGLAAGAPGTLILKTGLLERIGGGWNAGRQEVAFYRQVAGAIAPPVAPRCFDAHWDAETGNWHLVLEDLTESHFIATIWPLPPPLAQCESIVIARARFQAVWWDDPRLGASIGEWQDADAYLCRFADVFSGFIDRFGEHLPPERRILYERWMSAGPRLFARYHARHHLTIGHGDAHVWNCFLPRDEGGGIRFFDWDAWRIDIGAADLAYMIAIHWYPERRARLEQPLLDRYHKALLTYGVRGYDRAALADDYRLAVLWQIATPIWQAMYNIPPVIWWNNLERVLLAVDDLGCRDLLA